MDTTGNVTKTNVTVNIDGKTLYGMMETNNCALGGDSGGPALHGTTALGLLGGNDVLTDRARQVAKAWDGSTAAAAWRVGLHPMGETVQLPKGGMRSPADLQAYKDQCFVLRGELHVTWPKDGQVTWTAGKSLARPLVGAAESYQDPGRHPCDRETAPHRDRSEAG
ncbi:hypothetical protein [Streptomyces sp. NPDC012616]|uniref:hypothetical protein n=1 Tax=Streptomyces sp. NPDC012616 TaxID=3364840 RepID=UPI0036E2E887